MLRQTGPDEAERVAAFLRSIFPDNPKGDPDVLRWQYWENPWGPASSVVFEEDDEILAHCVAFPVGGRFRGEERLLTKGADGATSPTARGRGLYRAVATEAYAEAGRRGYPVNLATPNEKSVRGTTQAGMELISQVPLWVLPLDDAWVASQAKGLPVALARLGRRAVFGSRGPAAAHGGLPDPDEAAALWRDLDDGVTQGLLRDERWWGWRYARPGAAYEAVTVRGAGGQLDAIATALVREAPEGSVLYLLDLLARTDDAARTCVDTLVADRDDVVALLAAALPDTAHERALRAARLRRIPDRLTSRRGYVGLVHNQPGLGTVTDGPWQVSWADFDHL